MIISEKSQQKNEMMAYSEKKFGNSFFLFFGLFHSSKNERQKFILQRSEDIYRDPEEGSGLHGYQDSWHQDVCQINGQDDVNEWAEEATFRRQRRLQRFQTSGDSVNLEITMVSNKQTRE